MGGGGWDNASRKGRDYRQPVRKSEREDKKAGLVKIGRKGETGLTT